MLENLTPIKEVQEQKKKHKLLLQDDNSLILEKGIYISSVEFNFQFDEFYEIKEGKIYDFGVADNIEQIKKYFSEETKDPDNKYAVGITYVRQEKENKGKNCGWRWNKWGKYIGNLKPKHEYLDDENFGKDFKHIIVFEIYKFNHNETF